MMQLSAYSRLGGNPRSIDTTSGRSMTVANLAVEVAERGNDDPEPEWLSVIAFGGQAETLAKHAKGECAVSGRVQRNRYTDRQGNERVQLQIIADMLVSARTARPGGGKKAKADTGQSQGQPAGEDFDNTIPFRG